LNVHAAARAVLAETSVEAKLAGTELVWRDWQADRLELGPLVETHPLQDAGHPERPPLASPKDMPRRELNSPAGHAALIHALTHIEFNAINLGLDAAYRFRSMPAAFYTDWLGVAAEEAHHFSLLRAHLRSLGHEYGDFPAHAGLWEMARRTAHDPLARMALVPRLLEARGLDVTPDIQRKLRGYGDQAGAAILDVILRDEIGHVAAGDRWFRHFCAGRGLEPEATFQDLLQGEGVPRPRRPFNEAARLEAGFGREELDRLASN
jgi:uncharacterized ferritin-like protein (DUF455 family)